MGQQTRVWGSVSTWRKDGDGVQLVTYDGTGKKTVVDLAPKPTWTKVVGECGVSPDAAVAMLNAGLLTDDRPARPDFYRMSTRQLIRWLRDMDIKFSVDFVGECKAVIYCPKWTGIFEADGLWEGLQILVAVIWKQHPMCAGPGNLSREEYVRIMTVGLKTRTGPFANTNSEREAA